MPLKSIKNKITAMAEGEVLGDAAVNPEDLNDSILNIELPYKPQKNNKIKKSQSNKQLNTKNNISTENIKNKSIQSKKTNKNNKNNLYLQTKNKDLLDGYKDVLAMLGIPLTIDLNTEFNSEDLDYVEFTQTQPIGFDFDEVTDFISRVKYNLYKLESALIQRDSDVRLLASEIKRVEQKMIETNQAKELERMIGGMTQEEILIEKNMDLNVQVNELTRKLSNFDKNLSVNKDLMKEIEILRSENDILRMNNKISELPLINEDMNNNNTENIDLFVNMLDDIGGLYDDEQ